MSAWTAPDAATATWWSSWLPPAESTKVVAYKAHLTVHRSAHKVLARSWLTLSSRKWPRAWSGAQLEVQHFKWVDGLLPYLEKRVRTYRKCGMLWYTRARRSSAGSSRTVAASTAPSPRAGARRRDGRRVAIVASAWDEVVDGVSITMQRARHPRKRNDTEVIVVAPHTPGKVPKVDTSDIPTLHAGTLPIFRLIGRDEYSVGMPTARSSRLARRVRAARVT